MSSGTVILANGQFPENELPLDYLKKADRIICCDGAAETLVRYGFEPYAIVGDCDSLSIEIEEKYHGHIFRDSDQETNDLTKAVRWCSDRGYKDIVILGATGKREDHTIGNISLLAEYSEHLNVRMVTDTGVFIPFRRSCKVSSFPGQQVSIFTIDTSNEITSSGLRYPLNSKILKSWWEATLNEALDDFFELSFEGGPVIVYLKFKD